MITRWLDYLLTGTDADTLSDEWLASKMPDWDRWTRAQQQPGMALIVSDTATMARRQFWRRLAEKKQARRDNVTPMRRESSR